MPELSRLDSLLIVHAELPGPIDEATPDDDSASDYAAFLESRPRQAENDAIELMIGLSREFGTRIHIVHLSSADAVPLIRKARAEGVKISAETCPHYLHFAAETIPAGATEFKCCPPIRERENREQLWQALADGTIGMVVSDHSPCPGEMKLAESGDFLGAWGGICFASTAATCGLDRSKQTRFLATDWRAGFVSGQRNKLDYNIERDQSLWALTRT